MLTATFKMTEHSSLREGQTEAATIKMAAESQFSVETVYYATMQPCRQRSGARSCPGGVP